MELGSIAGHVPPNTFTPGGAMVGTLSASAAYVGGTYDGATAYTDLGTTGNTSSVTFTYQGSEAAWGAAVGVRWNDSAQQGIFAFIDSSGPTLKIYEMSSGWVFVQGCHFPESFAVDEQGRVRSRPRHLYCSTTN